MRIIAASHLAELASAFPDASETLREWYIKAADQDQAWNSIVDVRSCFNSADQVAVNDHTCLIFNIKGNHYRLICTVNYQYNMLYVRWFGTHQDYDRQLWKQKI